MEKTWLNRGEVELTLHYLPILPGYVKGLILRKGGLLAQPMVYFQFLRDNNLEGISIDTWKNPLTVRTRFARQPLNITIPS